MKWLFKIFLSFNIFLLCGSALACAPSYSKITSGQSSISSSQFSLTRWAATAADLRLSSATTSDSPAKLLTAELEEDNDESGATKKQSVKVSAAAIFLAAWNFAFQLPTRGGKLLSGKLPATLTVNKIYLDIQVLRL